MNTNRVLIALSFLGGITIAITALLMFSSLSAGIITLVICWAGTAYAAPNVIPFGGSRGAFAAPQVALGLLCLIGLLFKFLG